MKNIALVAALVLAAFGFSMNASAHEGAPEGHVHCCVADKCEMMSQADCTAKGGEVKAEEAAH
jgi:hypothetical protein